MSVPPSSPKRFEWWKMNPGHRSCSKHIPIELWSRWSRRWNIFPTASDEWILDGGAWPFQGYGENGLLRSLIGRLTGVHKVLGGAAGRQYFYLGRDVGYMMIDSQKNCSRKESSL